MKKIPLWTFIFLLIFILLFYKKADAQENLPKCDNRFAVLVNPVRGRDLWINKTLEPLKKQYELAKSYDVPITWLLQYDVLADKDIIGEIDKFDINQEKGVFLEVSEIYANDARVLYPYATSWFSPKAIFLSGYSQSDRVKLIDRLFEKFKLTFGFYPESVGAWWIDSYSLNYMKNKYGIKSAMIVADQKTTDSYGVWGQWWGVPYYPSKANILTPASTSINKQDLVIIQWAQRDPSLAYGEGPSYSNYSLQANDYKEQGKDTEYFKNLVNIYLDCKNNLGQITIGLETGIESVSYIQEYENQLRVLKGVNNLHFVTMSEFASDFARVYPDFPENFQIKNGESVWEMTTSSRTNKKLKDYIRYNPEISFADYFTPDTSNFLDRKLPLASNQKNSPNPNYFLWVGIGLGLVSIIKKRFRVWIWSMLFALGAFGLIFKSFYQYGWKIYYGPNLSQLELTKVVLVLLSFLVFLIIQKRFRNIYFLVFPFGFDPLIQSIRFSFISNKFYIGTILDSFRFVGISISSVNINFLNYDLPSYQAAAFLKFNFDKIWDNLYYALIIYPLTHLLIGLFLIYLFPKLSSKVRLFSILIMALLLVWHINNIIISHPRLVALDLLK